MQILYALDILLLQRDLLYYLHLYLLPSSFLSLSAFLSVLCSSSQAVHPSLSSKPKFKYFIHARSSKMNHQFIRQKFLKYMYNVVQCFNFLLQFRDGGFIFFKYQISSYIMHVKQKNQIIHVKLEYKINQCDNIIQQCLNNFKFNFCLA